MENMENAARKKVMLSGIQPSGDLTLGSYLGAIKNWAERDEEFDNYYFMADMHSITVRQDPAALRRRTLEQVSLSPCPRCAPAAAALQQSFDRLASGPDEKPVFTIESRQIAALRRSGKTIWFDFRELCGGPRSQNDYLEIASQFHTVLLSNVPHMPVSMASPARRFTWLVDVLYDRRVKLVLSAQVPPEELYTAGPLVHEFPRTASRLNAMQSSEYLALERRVADPGRTS